MATISMRTGEWAGTWAAFAQLNGMVSPWCPHGNTMAIMYQCAMCRGNSEACALNSAQFAFTRSAAKVGRQTIVSNVPPLLHCYAALAGLREAPCCAQPPWTKCSSRQRSISNPFLLICGSALAPRVALVLVVLYA
jgi:hypothetical protein